MLQSPPVAESVDLSNCDREPIHIPGAIQPHGVLLAVDATTHRILQVSENAALLLGRDSGALLHERLEVVLDASAAAALERGASNDESDALHVELEIGGVKQPFDVVAHRSDQVIVVELEPSTMMSAGELEHFFATVRAGVARIQKAPTVQQTLEIVVEEFVRVAGFDRTMAYRFDRDWHGEVVVERLSDDAQPSYLGLHYPASDVPRQARELYRRNVLRAIPDATYTPARLVPALNPLTDRPLDLSRSLLRSVSPMHLQYMANMGTRASLTASLLRHDELWGMIAAHHRTPRQVPYRVRVACELLARTASLQISALEERSEFAYRMRLRSLQPALIEAINKEGGFVRAVAEHGEFLEIADAEGVALRTEGEPILVGKTPRLRDVRRIIKWLEERGGNADEPFVTDELPLMNPDFEDIKDTAAGLLAVPLTTSRGGWLLWFRPESVREVSWGGDPAKPVDEANAAISPRRSFDVWKETVRFHSRPWLSAQVDAAIELRRLLSDVMMRRAREYAALNAELARSNEELESFAYVASHDLKEPLRGLFNYATFLTEDYAGKLDARGKELLASMRGLTKRMESQIESMLELARVGSDEAMSRRLPLDEALDAALELLAPRIEEEKVEIRRPGRLPTVMMNPARAREVFVNLVGNAIKYTIRDEKFVEIGVAEESGPPRERAPIATSRPADGAMATIYVRDNGIGIRDKHLETIFRMFKRLHPLDAFGGGTGAGLAIARKIVEHYGGTMWAQSVPDEGATFYFTVPLVED